MPVILKNRDDICRKFSKVPKDCNAYQCMLDMTRVLWHFTQRCRVQSTRSLSIVIMIYMYLHVVNEYCQPVHIVDEFC